MPKINRVRIVNFTYNQNRHIYDSMFDYYGGESTLNILANGGGKSVLVHMLMQPMVPKMNLKDRAFKSYFKKVGPPTYIMIEWLLDDNAGRVTTGIGIKVTSGKNSSEENDESIRVITFTSEYNSANKFDIENIDLTYREDNITKMVEFDRVIKNLSNAEKGNEYNVHVYRWEVPEDKKRYNDSLATYKINPSEWKRLMTKINEKEAGLGTFFDDCKTNKALINKWFMPAIEESLNKNGNIIEQIRELIKNHAEQLVLNEKIIEEKKVFELFKVKSQNLLLKLEKYNSILNVIEDTEFSIGNLYRFLNIRHEELLNKKDELKTETEKNKDAFDELLYNRLSYDYYKENNNLSNFLKERNELIEKIGGINEYVNELKHKQQVMECAEVFKDFEETGGDIVKKEEMLKTETMGQKQIENKLNDINYSLNLLYDKKIKQEDNTLSIKKEELSDINKSIEDYKLQKTSYEDEKSEFDKRLISAESSIAVFNQEEKNIKQRYKDFTLERNYLLQEYDKKDVQDYIKLLHDKKEDTVDKINRFVDEKDKNKEEMNQLEIMIKNARQNIQRLTRNVDQYKRSIKEYEKSREEILSIYKKYEINSDKLFYKDIAIEIIETELNKFNGVIRDLNSQQDSIEKYINMYESGKTIPIPIELKGALDDNGIDIDFGYEWLKNYSISAGDKETLLSNNPFIPYSIIMSRRDFENLKKIDLKLFTSLAFPVIERESLEDKLNIVTFNQIKNIGDMNFLMSFNQKLLDERHLRELLQQRQNELSEIKESIKDAHRAAQNTMIDKSRIEGFKYTEHEVESLRIGLENVENQLYDEDNNIALLEEKNLNIRKENEEIDQKLMQLYTEENNINRQIDEVSQLFVLYEDYLKSKAEKTSLEDSIKNIINSIEKLEKIIEGLKNEEYIKKAQINEVIKTLEEDTKEHAKYANAKSGNMKTGTIIDLKAEREGLISQQGGNVKSLQRDLDSLNKRYGRLYEKLQEYNIPEIEYTTITYSFIELKEIKALLEDYQNKEKKLNSQKDKLSGRIEETQKSLKYKYSEIHSRCQGRDPKAIEAIEYLDFDKVHEALILEKNNLESKMHKLNTEINKLDGEINKLYDYREFQYRVENVETIEDLFEYRTNIINEYKNLQNKRDVKKEELRAEYNNFEMQFIDKADIFEQLFTNLLDDEKKYKYEYGSYAIERAIIQIDMKLKQHSIDIQRIEDMERSISDITLEYVKKVYDEMASIDRNSAIDIFGSRKKMLTISMPPKEGLDEIILKEYVKGTISNCVSLYKQGKPMDNLLANEINTIDLFDRLIGINRVAINLTKIEQNKTIKLTWREAISTSGGERFVSAFVIFISLLSYSRGSNVLKHTQDSKVLIMDNPFGAISSEHLLIPMFEVAKKYDTQLICFTDHDKPAICDRFNLIYAFNVEREVGRYDEYLDVKIKKNLVKKDEEEILTSSMFKVEQQSLFQ